MFCSKKVAFMFKYIYLIPTIRGTRSVNLKSCYAFLRCFRQPFKTCKILTTCEGIREKAKFGKIVLIYACTYIYNII